MTFLTLISDIEGLLGMYLGLSLLTIFNKLFKVINNFIEYKNINVLKLFTKNNVQIIKHNAVYDHQVTNTPIIRLNSF